MTPEDFKGLRDCCQDEAAFERMQEILQAVARRSPPPLPPSNGNSYLPSPSLPWSEQALQEGEQRFRCLIENATDVIVILDQQGIFRYCSPSSERVLGYTQPDIVGRSAVELVKPTDVGLILHTLQCAIAQPGIPQPAIEYSVRHRNGSWRTFEAVTTSLLHTPAIRGVVVNCHDISQRNQVEAALRESEDRLQLTLEVTQMGVWSYDLQTEVTRWSDSCERLFGLQPGTFDQRIETFLARVHPHDRAYVLEQIVCQTQQGINMGKEFRIIWPDGSLRWISERSHTVYNDRGQATLMLGVSMDITEAKHNEVVRKQAEEALRQQTEREQLIGTIAHRIPRSLDLKEILDATVAEVRQFLEADRVTICFYFENGEVLVQAESVGAGWQSLLGMRIQTTWGIKLLTQYQAGKKLVIENTAEIFDPPEFRESLLTWQAQAVLAVPIVQGDRVWGVLVAHQCASVRQWQPIEIATQEQLATQVAIAIQQSELYQQVQQLNAQLEAQVQERTAQLQQALNYEATLKRITDAVRDSLDEEQILQTAVQELGRALDVEGCDATIHHLEQQTSVICYEYLRSDLPSAKGATCSFSLKLHQETGQQQAMQFCLLHNAVRPSPKRYSTLACPIAIEQEPLGELWLFKPAAQRFSELEVRLAQQVANQCAIAIRQTRLFQATQAQVATLEELNRLKDDFLSTVSHELRTPMSNMKMAIYLLRSLKSPERQERYLDILQAECGREIDLINDLLDLQRLEAAAYPVTLESIDLRSFLDTLMQPFFARARDRQQTLTLQLPVAPSLISDRGCLERILAELLNNACKYTPPQGEIVLSLEVILGASTLAIALRNSAEIPQSALARIFEKFYRVPESDRWKQGGTGLGLALVQRLVKQLNGTIAVDSSNGWTTFQVKLPQFDVIQ